MILLGHCKTCKIPFLHPPSFSRQGKYKETRVPSLSPANAEHGSGTCHVHTQTNMGNSGVGCSWWEVREESSRIQQFTPRLFFQLGFFFSLSQGYHSIGELNGWGPKRKYQREYLMLYAFSSQSNQWFLLASHHSIVPHMILYAPSL